MIRILLGMLLTLELVSGAFAFKMPNGQLIAHREWTTGDAVVSAKDSLVNKHQQPVHYIFKTMPTKTLTVEKDAIELHSKTYNEEGTVGTESILRGEVSVYLENYHSNTPKTYKILTRFCVAQHCANSTYEIQVNPYEFIEFTINRVVTFNFSAPGEYPSILYSAVNSDELTSYFVTIAQGSIQVSP